jgi:dihydroxyacetone kinase
LEKTIINFKGDRLNFGVAVERFKSMNPKSQLALLYIDDDVALEQRALDTATGSRGIVKNYII